MLTSCLRTSGIFIFLYVMGVSFVGNCVMAQRVHVPYRVKERWGVSDQEGKIILKPVYDEIIWSSDELSRLPNGFYKVKKNGKVGLVHDKEIVPPVYNDIYVQQGVLVKAYKGNKERDFFTLHGKRILPDYLQAEDAQVIQLLPPDVPSHVPSVVALIHVKTADGEKGCYFYHSKNPSASRMLHQGYDRINYRIYKDPAGFTIYLSNRSGFKQEVHYLLNNANMQLDEVYTQPEEKEREKQHSGIEVREYSITDMDHTLTVPEPDEPFRNQSPTFRRVRYKWENDSLFAHYSFTKSRARENISYKMYVPLPAGSYNVQLQEHYGEQQPTFVRHDTTYQYQNTVVFKVQEKQALISGLTDQAFMYDSIQVLRNRGQNRFEFVFGNKDPIGKMKFGIKNFADSTVLPAVYEHLGIANPGVHYFARRGKAIYVVQQHQRWGIIEEDGQMLVPCAYDSVYAVFGKEAGIPFHVLVKNKKYGVYIHTTEISAPSVWREPFTVYPPKRLVFIYRGKGENMTCVEHETPEGKTIGLSGDNGKVYWKD